VAGAIFVIGSAIMLFIVYVKIKPLSASL
jgi:hypothetical protein